MIAFEYLLLMLPLVWEVSTDWYRIRIKKKPDNHKQDLLPRFGFCLLAALGIFLLFGSPFLPALIYSGCLFSALFDPIMGLILHGNPLYKSPTSRTDQFILGNTPPMGEVFARLWIISVGIGCYYQWDLVIGR